MATVRQPENNVAAEVILLLRQLVALELWKSGVSQADIGKRLGIATATVNKYLKGVKRIVS